MNAPSRARLLFITGTDTGVGKTVLTALLLSHLRRRNLPVLAIKPFCSGDRADAQLLCQLQGGDLALDEINPFFFPEPLAPLVAARSHKRTISLDTVLNHIHTIAQLLPHADGHNPGSTTPILLIEGAGGLMVPLGSGYFVLDLIRESHSEVIVVSRNALGTLNHTLLTVQALEAACPHLAGTAAKKCLAGFSNCLQGNKTRRPKTFANTSRARGKVVLMQQSHNDASAASNPDLLAQFLHPVPLWKLPFFRGNLRTPQVIQKIGKKIEKTLAQILD